MRSILLRFVVVLVARSALHAVSLLGSARCISQAVSFGAREPSKHRCTVGTFAVNIVQCAAQRTTAHSLTGLVWFGRLLRRTRRLCASVGHAHEGSNTRTAAPHRCGCESPAWATPRMAAERRRWSLIGHWPQVLGGHQNTVASIVTNSTDPQVRPVKARTARRGRAALPSLSHGTTLGRIRRLTACTASAASILVGHGGS
jgi:hypothetical protein